MDTRLIRDALQITARPSQIKLISGKWRETVLDLCDAVDASRAALLTIRQATNLALPSEQTGEEWTQTVRVPVARLQAIDAAVASVLGEMAATNEPMPKLHGEKK